MASHTLATCSMGVGPSGGDAMSASDADGAGVVSEAGAVAASEGAAEAGTPSEDEAGGDAAGAAAALCPEDAPEQPIDQSQSAPHGKEPKVRVDQQRVCLIESYPSQF